MSVSRRALRACAAAGLALAGLFTYEIFVAAITAAGFVLLMSQVREPERRRAVVGSAAIALGVPLVVFGFSQVWRVSQPQVYEGVSPGSLMAAPASAYAGIASTFPFANGRRAAEVVSPVTGNFADNMLSLTLMCVVLLAVIGFLGLRSRTAEASSGGRDATDLRACCQHHHPVVHQCRDLRGVREVPELPRRSRRACLCVLRAVLAQPCSPPIHPRVSWVSRPGHEGTDLGSGTRLRRHPWCWGGPMGAERDHLELRA